MSKKVKLVSSVVVALVPGVALAANGLSDITTQIGTIKTLVGTTIPGLIFALALAYFLYGVLSYVSTGAEEKNRGEAKNTMIYGIIVLFVMSSVWGLVKFVQSATGINGNDSAPPFPTV